ncbi:XrtA/PEP-CTERM system TPR-repeat protein PrsT [Halochromatium glycolicum]|nr:XrtA/PEP-CTERM system TPR-repeat protein PrsT [Halochromatium glycolicum]
MRRLIPLLTVWLAALVLVSGCGKVTYSAEEHVARAEQAYAEGNLRQAVIEIKNALQQEPDRAEARRLLGEFNLLLGKAVEAEAELVRAEDLGGDPSALRLPLLRAWLMQGKNEAVIDATASMQTFGEAQQPTALTLRAQALLAEGQLDEARSALDQALELEPQAAEALLGLAWVEWLNEDPEATRTQLRAALDAEPTLDRAWELLGDVEREAGQLEAAEAAYTKALETTRQPFSPRFKRALTQLFQQDYEGADQDVQALQAQFEEHAAVSYMRGLIAFYQQRYEDARTELEETLSRDPNYLPAAFYLGASHYALENWQQAENHLSRYARRVPESAEASRLLALTRLREGDSERAEQALHSVLEHNPEDQATLALMSNLYLAQGRADEALHHLRRVIAVEPESAGTRAQLGLALLQEGQREKGFSELERAIQLAPEQESLRLEVAMILERLRAKEHQQALELIERLRDRDDVKLALYYNLKGLAYLGAGDTAAAEAIFRDGLDSVPDAKADLASNLAGLMARDGRVDEAKALTTTYLEDYPEHLGLLSNAARLDAARGDLVEAEALLERAVAAHPNALAPRRGLAEIYLQTDRPEEAVVLLREGEEAYGSSVDWLRLMTLALLRSEDRESAVNILRRLQEQQPEAADVPMLLGRLLVDLGREDEGLAALERGLELHPDHLEARLIVVELLTRQGRIDEAAEVLAPAQAQHPDHPQVLGLAGAIANNQGRLDDSLTAFEKALEQDPDDRYLVGALAQAQAEAGDRNGSVQTLSNWMQRHPEDQELRLRLANQLLALQRNEEAITVYRRFLERSPDNLIALNNLAWLLRTKEPEEATQLVERAIEQAPAGGAILDTKGIIEMEQGNLGAAVSTLIKAIQLSPESPAIRLNLAKALIKSNRKTEAREQLKRIISDHPGSSEHKEAHELLATLPQAN